MLSNDSRQALAAALSHYSERALVEQASVDDVALERGALSQARDQLLDGRPLGVEEQALLRRAVETYIGHLSRGGYSQDPPPTRAEVDAADQAREAVLAWPTLSAHRSPSEPLDELPHDRPREPLDDPEPESGSLRDYP